MSSELIARLVTDLRPVRRLHTTTTRTALWLGTALACAVFGVSLLGVRPDLITQLRHWPFVAEQLCLLAVSVLGAYSAFRLGVPAVGKTRMLKLLPLVACGAWIVSIAARAAPAAAPMLPTVFCWRCGCRMASLALVPALVSLVMLRRTVPLAPRWSGCFSLLAASALGMLATQVLCVRDEPLHVLYFHALPVALMAGLGAWAGNRWSSALTRNFRAYQHEAPTPSAPL